MLYNIVLTRSFVIKSLVDQYQVSSIRAPTGYSSKKSPVGIQCEITPCWPGSYGIKSPTDQDQVLYNIMLARFFLYKVAC